MKNNSSMPLALAPTKLWKSVACCVISLGVSAVLPAAQSDKADASIGSASMINSGELSVDTLQGMDVNDPAGEGIGTVSDLVIDAATGRAVLVLVATEDEDRPLLVPLASLSLKVDEPDAKALPMDANREWYRDGAFTLNITDERLASIPRIDSFNAIDSDVLQAIESLTEVFGVTTFSQPSDDKKAQYRLASELAEIDLSRNDGAALAIDHLAIDAAGNGKATYILEGDNENNRRVSFADLEWQSDSAATARLAADATARISD